MMTSTIVSFGRIVTLFALINALPARGPELFCIASAAGFQTEGQMSGSPSSYSGPCRPVLFAAHVVELGRDMPRTTMVMLPSASVRGGLAGNGGASTQGSSSVVSVFAVLLRPTGAPV